MNTYEMMCLFDPTAGTNWETVEAEINRLMERAGGETLIVKRLEERRLAFEIEGRKRALYVIVYFKANGDKIQPLERDVRLSEIVLRVLILRAEGISLEKMEAATLGAPFGERGDRFDGDRGDRDRGDRDRGDRDRGDRDRGDRGDRGGERGEELVAAAPQGEEAKKASE